MTTPATHSDDIAQIDAESPFANQFYDYFQEYGDARAFALLAGLINFYYVLAAQAQVKH